MVAILKLFYLYASTEQISKYFWRASSSLLKKGLTNKERGRLEWTLCVGLESEVNGLNS